MAMSPAVTVLCRLFALALCPSKPNLLGLVQQVLLCLALASFFLAPFLDLYLWPSNIELLADVPSNMQVPLS